MDLLSYGELIGTRALSFYFWKIPVVLISFCWGFVFEGFLGRFCGKFGDKLGGKLGGKLLLLIVLVLLIAFMLLFMGVFCVFIGCWLLKMLFFF